MEAFEQYTLINQKKWTELLKGLEVGVHTLAFPSIPDINSFKSVAYKLNADRLGRKYSVRADKGEKVATLTIKAV